MWYVKMNKYASQQLELLATVLGILYVTIDAEQLDFVSLSATIHFPTGTPSGAQQCVCVTILDDRIVEGTEQFEITLSSTSGNAIIEDELAVVSILDTGEVYTNIK